MKTPMSMQTLFAATVLILTTLAAPFLQAFEITPAKDGSGREVLFVKIQEGETKIKDSRFGIEITLDKENKRGSATVSTTLISNANILNITLASCGNADTNGEFSDSVNLWSRNEIRKSPYYKEGNCIGGVKTISLKKEVPIINMIGLHGGTHIVTGLTVLTKVNNYANSGNLLKVKDDLKAASMILVNFYKGIQVNLSKFQNQLREDDNALLIRLSSLVQDGLNQMIDEKEFPKLPVTHTKIMENARVVMVVSSVLEYLIGQYKNSEWAKGSPLLENLKNFPILIREIYGWENGMAGQGSAVYRAIGEVLTLELRNFYFQIAELGNVADASVFIELQKYSSALQRKAQLSSDTACGTEVQSLINQWNQPEVQQLITKLLEARDNTAIQTRLRILLTAVQSLASYSRYPVTLPQLGN